MSNNLFDPLLLRTARAQVKQAFVDPSTASGGGGDPSQGGGDPSQGGGDPSQGGAPPPGGGGAPGAADVNAQLQAQAANAPQGLTEDRVMQMIQAAQQGGGMGGGAGGAGAMGPNGMPKKKVDVNTEIYQIKKLLVYMLQTQGVTVPPEMLLGDPADDPQADPNQAAQDPASAGAAPGVQQSSIPPIKPMGGASPALAAGGGGGAQKQSQFLNRGSVMNPSFLDTVNQASGLQALIRQANAG
jgi:hypothetical protein